MRILAYKAVEKIIIFLNRTILSGYREWKWGDRNKVVGTVISSSEEYAKWCEELRDE